MACYICGHRPSIHRIPRIDMDGARDLCCYHARMMACILNTSGTWVKEHTEADCKDNAEDP